MSSFIAAGTAYATHARQPDPVLHLLLDVRLPADRGSDLAGGRHARRRAFCSAPPRDAPPSTARACSTRTATADLLASTIPTLLAYDPAFAYEVAVIISDGLRRMYAEGEDVFYYLTLYNENYTMPPMPEGVEAGHPRRACTNSRPAPAKLDAARRSSWAAAPSCARRLRAQTILAERYGVSADVWSATSYKLLRNDALKAQRWNLLHPARSAEEVLPGSPPGKGNRAHSSRCRIT